MSSLTNRALRATAAPAPISVARQIALLLAAAEGLFDTIPLEAMASATAAVVKAVDATPAAREIEKGASLEGERREAMLCAAHAALLEVE